MESFIIKYRFIICIILSIIYFISIFLVEYCTRDTLFDYSLTVQKNWRKNESPTLVHFCEFVSEFANKSVLYSIYLLIYVSTPLNIGYTIISISFTCTYIENTLKLVYTSPRPFWINPALQRGCNGSYGNPSGHAVRVVATYVSLWHIGREHNVFNIKHQMTKNVVDSLLLIVIMGLIFCIDFARVYLDVHAINQVMFGSAIGFGIYFFHCFVLQTHLKIHNNEFIPYMLNIINQSVYFSVYFILFFITLFIYLIKEYEGEKYEKNLQKICPEVLNKIIFSDGAYADTLNSLFLVGFHYSLTLFLYLSYKTNNKIELWNSHLNKTSVKKTMLRFLAGALLGSLLFILSYIPESESVILFFIFQNAMPILIIGFILGYPFQLMCIQLDLVNKPPDDIDFIPIPSFHFESEEEKKLSQEGENKEIEIIEIK